MDMFGTWQVVSMKGYLSSAKGGTFEKQKVGTTDYHESYNCGSMRIFTGSNLTERRQPILTSQTTLLLTLAWSSLASQTCHIQSPKK